MTNNQTITITFCDRAENHIGMQQIGSLADTGFSLDDLLIYSLQKNGLNKKEVR